MACRKRCLLMLVLLLLLPALLVTAYRLSVSRLPPPGIPEGWQLYKELFGKFEIWLPKGWEASGAIPTLIYRLRQIATEPSSPPVLFTALETESGTYPQWIEIVGYDGMLESLAPLTGATLARECSRIHPVELTLDSTETVCLDGSGVTTVEVQGGIVAYQSKVLEQYAGYNLVRTVACIASPGHLYLVYLDTIESSEGPRTHEMILKGLRILK